MHLVLTFSHESILSKYRRHRILYYEYLRPLESFTFCLWLCVRCRQHMLESLLEVLLSGRAAAEVVPRGEGWRQRQTCTGKATWSDANRLAELTSTSTSWNILRAPAPSRVTKRNARQDNTPTELRTTFEPHT